MHKLKKLYKLNLYFINIYNKKNILIMEHTDSIMTDDIREYILDEIKSTKEIKDNVVTEVPVQIYDIEVEKNIINNYYYGLGITQGGGRNMEDRYIIDIFLDNPIFIILDGHHGSHVSDYCKKNLIRILRNLNEKMEHHSDIIKNFKLLFSNLIEEMDKELSKYSMEHSSGTTITIIYILHNYIFSVNLGDSKSILINKNFEYNELTNDHKPYISIEKNRIYNAHGNIVNNCINNDMNISRTLGDFRYKNQNLLKPCEQLISNIPHISVYTRNGSEKYLILSSNGIWDIFTNQKLIDYINKLHNEIVYDIKDITRKIIEKSMSGGNCGNTTLCIIKF
jgi:serine/threonine protein phosphatase PrpC